MADTPNKYSDPFWTDLASATEGKLDLPKGLLVSVLTKGERSNADQVSEAGARTPFQIIPQTRQAAIKNYGIDPYLSPENAAEVAGLLLKDSLKRNGGDTAAAVGEYHGGTNRDNWGPRTNSYVNRVLSGVQTVNLDSLKAGFGAWLKANPATPDNNAVKPTTQQLTDQLATAAKADNSQPVAPELAKGFGEWLAVQKPEETPENLGLIGNLKESITGEHRKTATTEALPDWAGMPELNDFSWNGFKTGLGTLLSSPQETVQIIQANYPGVQVRQDEKGNFVLKSSMDGKEYAIKPGFQVSDIPRAVAAIAAFTPAGRAATLPGMVAGAAGTQAIIEGSQAATGGSFDPKEVAIAGLTAGIVPPVLNATRRVATAVANPVKAAVQKIMPGATPAAADAGAMRAAEGVAPAAAPARAVAPESPTPAAVAQPAAPAVAAPVEQMTAQDLAATAKTAAEGGLGSKKATQVLAEQAAPNAKTVQAAERLGIQDYLQADHVTTNQAYRELAQAVKSIPGSEARAAEMQGLSQVAKRADDLITEIGGSHDLAQVSQGIKQDLQATQQQLEQQANKLYGQLRDMIPAKAEAPAPTILKFIEQRAEDLGGKQNLSSVERMIQAKLSPKPITDAEGAIIGYKQPSYALLDDVRRDLTAARIKAQGPFKDADSGLIKRLEGQLKVDQRAVVEQHGATSVFDAAQKAVAVRKGLEDDLVSLFGKNIDGSIVGNLSGAVKSLPSGDTSKFINLIKLIPENMRQETVASGLATAFGKNARNGSINFTSYAKWYEGLLKNKQAYAALMSNLPPAARKQLSDLYRVSKGISQASKERITTGRIQAVTDELKGADSLLANIYGLAKRSVAGAAVEAVTTPLGMPGAGISASIASALTKGKPSALKAADALISSPEFSEAVKQAAKGETKQAALKLAYSKQFTKFVRAVGNPKEMSNRERWILQAIEASSANQRQSNGK